MPAVDAPGPSLIRTKLLAPVARGTVQRRSAVAPLCEPRRLALVRAPAGWGKSSLAAAWAAEDPRPFAWVALDRRDNAPTRFFTYAIAALRSLRPSAGARSLEILLAGGGLLDEVLPALLDELEQPPEPIVLVLDDYHLVEADEIHEAVTFLLEHAPGELQLALLTRTEPPLPLARLRGRGELVEVPAEQLRFSPAEADELLNDGQGLALSAADVERLVERTEGWPAGLYLAALSLRGRQDASERVARFAGDDRHVVDYLTEEVLAGQPDEVRGFLLDTCILDRLCAPLCDAMRDREDSATMLRRIEASNLLLVPLDHHREWYRYHHLFADLLRLEIRGRTTTDLHTRAAAWHLEHGMVSEAVAHSAAGGDVDGAVEAIAANWLPALLAGEHHAVVRWLDALPEDVVRADSRLAFARGMTYVSVGRIDEVDDWSRALATATPRGPSYDGFSSPQAASHYLRCMHRWMTGDVPPALEAAEAALAHDGPSGPWDVASLSVAGTARYWLGDADRGRAEVDEALAQARAVGFGPPIITSLGILGFFDVREGMLDAARGRAHEALELTERAGLREHWVSCIGHTVLGELLRADGHHDEAVAEFQRGRELASRGAGVLALLTCTVALASAQDGAARQALLAEARAIVDGCPDPGDVSRRLLAEVEARGGAAPRQAVALGEPFSERELEVLRMLTGPMSQREIGQELFISFNTVKSHTKAIYRKLGAADRQDALLRARELGLL